MWNELRFSLLTGPEMLATLVVRFLSHAVGLWIVIDAGAGLHVGGSLGQRLVLAAGLAGVVTAVTLAIGSLGSSAVWRGAVSVVAVMAAVLSTPTVGRLLDVPVGAAGPFWSSALATAAASVVAYQVGRVPQAIVNDEWAADPPLLGGALLTLGGLWLVQAVLGGVRIAGTTGGRLAVLAVLACLFRLGGSNLLYFYRSYGMRRAVPSVLLPLLITTGKLWLLCRVSVGTAAPLTIDGVGTFALAAVLLAVVTAPVSFLEQWLAEERAAEEYRSHWEAANAQQAAITSLTLASAWNAARTVDDMRRRRPY